MDLSYTPKRITTGRVIFAGLLVGLIYALGSGYASRMDLLSRYEPAKIIGTSVHSGDNTFKLDELNTDVASYNNLFGLNKLFMDPEKNYLCDFLSCP